jgi:hypothetical protein
MIYYLIVDKNNHIVTSFAQKDSAEDYVKKRPYLKIVEFEEPNTSNK